MKCPKCNSDNTHRIGYGSTLIAIDDSVDYELMFCRDCENEWTKYV